MIRPLPPASNSAGTPVEQSADVGYTRFGVRIFVFHYHVLPGGVTDVIINSIRAILQNRSDIESVTLVTGREENTEAVLSRISEGGHVVSCDVVAELDYTPATEPLPDTLARCERLKAVLARTFGGDDVLWWVHNYHVGKNPAFTRAICELADAGETPRTVLHIHDFPECARYENLEYLTRTVDSSPYPSSPAVQYAVINRRDRDALVEAGMPSDRVHLLLNPVPRPSGGHHGSRPNLMHALQSFADSNGSRFRPENPVLLYPIRCIRRKNVLEMGLLARLAGDWNLVTTLPGLSELERPYSQLVSYAYESGAIDGVFGIGRQESHYGTSFEELTHHADVIVSSSVQEGFGMLFVNALQWGAPLFARHLPVLEGIMPVFNGYPARFYGSLRVPFESPGLSNYTSYLRMRYKERLDSVAVVPDTARRRMEVQLESILGGDAIDFAYLPPETQFALLKDAADPGFAEIVRELNQETVAALRDMTGRAPDIAERVEKTFGYEAFAGSFARLLASFPEPRSGAGTGRSAETRFDGVRERLVSAFADIDQFRLLTAPMGHHG